MTMTQSYTNFNQEFRKLKQATPLETKNPCTSDKCIRYMIKRDIFYDHNCVEIDLDLLHDSVVPKELIS